MFYFCWPRQTDFSEKFDPGPFSDLDHTNHLERALRAIPMGRKNWLFCWTELGAKQVGILQSLIVTCRLHGIDPYTYRRRAAAGGPTSGLPGRGTHAPAGKERLRRIRSPLHTLRLGIGKNAAEY